VHKNVHVKLLRGVGGADPFGGSVEPLAPARRHFARGTVADAKAASDAADEIVIADAPVSGVGFALVAVP